MAQNLYHQYAIATSVGYSDVRGALDKLTDDDVSQSSPLTAGGSEVGIELTGEGEDPGGILHVRVEGHEGEWTKTSEDSLRRAVQSVEGVGELLSSTGGYEQDDDDSEATTDAGEDGGDADGS